MFNDLLEDTNNVLLASRLNRALPIISEASYATSEEYQASISSTVNRILALKNQMQALTNIKAGTPALIGDFTSNLQNLNEDAADTVSEIIAIENNIAYLFNLGEASQSYIRQVIREQLFANNTNTYTEAFINNLNIQNTTATMDFQAGVALLPLVNSTELVFSLATGASSIGSSDSPLSYLTDDEIYTTYTWNGNQLELICTLSSQQPVNRLVLSLDNYDGLAITTFTSTPDGTIFNDILASLNVRSISLNANSGKYSGSIVIDFPPQQAATVQIIIQNTTNSGIIALRNMYLYSRQYESSGQFTSTLINAPLGDVAFSYDQLTPQFTNIVHQYSYDNVHFTSLLGGQLNLTQPFWYRALLSRSTAPSNSTGLSTTITNSTNYTVSSSSSISLGSNITEFTIVLSSISGPITLGQNPLPNSLKIQVNSTVLNPSQYTFTNNTITLNSSQNNVTIVYQTTSLTANTLAALQNYYTPVLTQITFEA